MMQLCFQIDAPRLLQPGVGLGSPGGLRNPSAGASQLGNVLFIQFDNIIVIYVTP